MINKSSSIGLFRESLFSKEGEFNVYVYIASQHPPPPPPPPPNY